MILLGKYINKYYLKYWLFFLLGIAALIVVDVFNLFVPEQLGRMVDLMGQYDKALTPFEQEEIMSSITFVGFSVMGVGLIMAAGRASWRLTLFYASGKIQAGLRSEMFAKAEKLSQRYYHQEKVGNVLAWFTTDIETIEEYMGFGTVMLVDSMFMSILVFIKMFLLSVPLTLLLLVPIAIIALWGAFSEKLFVAVWNSRQKANDKLYDFATESFSGIRVIKAFVKEKQQESEFRRIANKCQKEGVKVAKVNGAFERMIELFLNVVFGVLMLGGGYLIYMAASGNPFVLFGENVNLTVPELVTYIAYFDALIWPVIALGQVITMHGRSKASLGRISDFLDQEEEIILADGDLELKDVKGDIEFKDFSFAYPGAENKVLEGVNFSIKGGENVGIIGKIGRGKTTLVDCLLRLYNVEPGSIYIDGVDIMKAKISSVRGAISYVPQDNFLFSDTIENNIGFSSDTLDEKAVVEAAEFASVEKDIEDFKYQYKTMLGERGTTVSGGQKQRLSMARAYYKDAPIMIMDDSVSAVDVNTEEKILKNIKEKRAGKTTIIIASRISTVSHLDKVLVLADGKVEAFGSPKELMESSPTYARMAMLQKLEQEVEEVN